MSINTYSNLEDIRFRKEQLSEAIDKDNQLLGELWEQLFAKKENPTRGEQIVSLVSHTVTAVDTFLLVRKLMKSYGSVFGLFSQKSKKKRKR